MSDLYSELLVKKDRTAKDVIIKYGLITLTVLFAIAGLFIFPIYWWLPWGLALHVISSFRKQMWNMNICS